MSSNSTYLQHGVVKKYYLIELHTDFAQMLLLMGNYIWKSLLNDTVIGVIGLLLPTNPNLETETIAISQILTKIGVLFCFNILLAAILEMTLLWP